MYNINHKECRVFILNGRPSNRSYDIVQVIMEGSHSRGSNRAGLINSTVSNSHSGDNQFESYHMSISKVLEHPCQAGP
jgi:hypothetical protein